MSIPHIRMTKSGARCLAIAALTLTAGLGVAEHAGAGETPTSLLAPFACGSEWAGTTRSGHGLLDMNLDINSTARTFAEPQHDLGSPLFAQAAGVVVWIGTHSSAGTYVEIDYGDVTVVYVHLVHGSVPETLEVGSEVRQGQLFGLLGDTGNATHAHLHLEYFDSADYGDARKYLLPRANQIQITMDGEAIDPGETFTSTNCSGDAGDSEFAPPDTLPFADLDPGSFAYGDVAHLFDLGVTKGTSATTYSPQRSVTREEMAAFLGRLWQVLEPEVAIDGSGDPAIAEEPTQIPFEDVDPTSFAFEDIAMLAELEITRGTSDTTFSPYDAVTREQMAAFLARLWHRLGLPAPDPGSATPLPFDDVEPTSFARDDIETLFRLGITTGTSTTTFSPDDDVTREQMAAFLARLHRLADPDPPVEVPDI